MQVSAPIARISMLATTICLGLVLASCQAVSPDPQLRNASKTKLSERVRMTCNATQARLQKISLAKLERGCGCYAARTMRALTPAEIQAFRDTSVFNASARVKALAAIDACGLKRP
jgi:hypothetical protein